MPIDPVVFGLALGTLLGTLAGLVAPRPGLRAKRSWPVTESVARDLEAARRVLVSLAEQLNEARRTALNLETRVCQTALDKAGIEESDLPKLAATLRALGMQAGTGPASDSEEAN